MMICVIDNPFVLALARGVSHFDTDCSKNIFGTSGDQTKHDNLDANGRVSFETGAQHVDRRLFARRRN